MSVSDASVRELSFPLQNPEVIAGDTPADGTPAIPFTWSTLDSDEKVIVTMELSLSEYVALASCVDVGRDIAFGTDTNLIWWIWTRCINSMSLCEQIIDCIENDTETRDALLVYLNESGFGSGAGTSTNPAYYDSDPTWLDGSQISGCNNDNLFGGITQLIDFINARIVDFTEQAEVVTNAVERIQLAIAGVPVVGAFPADEIIGFADQLIEELSEAYVAAFTQDLRDEYRCDLFCLVKDTCELDFQQFADYFLGRVGTAIDSGDTFLQAITWFTTGVFSGDTVVDAMFGLVCQALAYSSAVFGININGLATSLTAAMNDPDSDWMILCDDCGAEFPELTTARCDAGQVFGSITQESANTWLLQFENTDPTASIVTVSSVGFVPYQILSIEDIVVGALKTATFFDEPCTLVSGGWGGAIERVNCNGYALATNTPLASVRIVVAPLP